MYTDGACDPVDDVTANVRMIRARPLTITAPAHICAALRGSGQTTTASGRLEAKAGKVAARAT